MDNFRQNNRGFIQHHFHTKIINMFLNIKSKYKSRYNFRLSSESGAGFTIIELIVVIAIIGVLAAIVLTNVTGYIKKGKDAAIKGSMNGFVTNGTIYYESHGNYGAFCNNTATQNIYNSIVSANKYCHHNNDNWVVCIQLNEDNTKAWCVDNTGAKRQMNDSSCKSDLSVCP